MASPDELTLYQVAQHRRGGTRLAYSVDEVDYLGRHLCQVAYWYWTPARARAALRRILEIDAREGRESREYGAGIISKVYPGEAALRRETKTPSRPTEGGRASARHNDSTDSSCSVAPAEGPGVGRPGEPTPPFSPNPQREP